jgi:PepSY-associated transmembrane protein
LLKAWLLRLHRWVALLIALPLVVILATGFILSFEPMLVIGAIKPGSVDAAKIERLLVKHDPEARARGLSLRSYANTLTLGIGRQAGPIVDLETEDIARTPSALANWLQTSRRLHETLLIDARWLVTASTMAMLGLICLGISMGLPQLRNTVAGWHKATAWILLPLVVLSPLTGLAVAYGVTFTTPPPRGSGQPAITLIEAVRIVGREHDLSNLIWLRSAGSSMLARLVENGEYRVHVVTPSGLSPAERNWPRLQHEGNWRGFLSSCLNLVTSVALIGLLGTGMYLWGRRQVRRRPSSG